MISDRLPLVRKRGRPEVILLSGIVDMLPIDHSRVARSSFDVHELWPLYSMYSFVRIASRRYRDTVSAAVTLNHPQHASATERTGTPIDLAPATRI